MTVSEYKVALAEAIEQSIKERWEVFAEDPESKDAIDCPFCDLGVMIDGDGKWDENAHPCRCPLDETIDGYSTCGPEYEEFMYAETIEDKKAAARAMIARLRSIDIDAFAAKLLDAGVLEANA